VTSRFVHSAQSICAPHPPISNSRRRVWIACLCLLLTVPACAQFASLQLKSLCVANELGAQPFAGLVAGPDDRLYGTTYSGAGAVRGTVFSIHRDGSGFTLLHRFTGTTTDGADPYSALIVGNDGRLYGTTSLGGSSNEGTVFSIHPNGSGFQILHSFAATTNDAKQPYAGLIQARDGALYGTTQFGGISNQGAIFTLQTDASGYSLLHQFTGAAGDGSQPTAKLIEGSDDALYGTTHFGGNTNLGTVFKLNKDGTAFSILHSFSGTIHDGAHPYASLIEGPDGMLYGTTIEGGTADRGTVFKLTQGGQNYSILHNFTGTTNDGAQPYSPLLRASDDRLYGATAFGGNTDSGTLFQIDPDGTAYQLLRSFINTNQNPSLPYSVLIEDSDGALHGATWAGGNNNHGALYRLNKDGQDFTVLHSFARGQDAIAPYGTLLEASNQILYGTTWTGGSHDQGTIFKLNQNGSQYAILRNLSDSDGDGTLLNAGLIEGTDGSLYGTAVTGGPNNSGAVIAIDKDGSRFRVLRNFTGTAGDGFYPYAGLLEASDGALYGTTAYGGTSSRGTIFRMTKTGGDYAILHHFIGTTSGAHPFAPLIEASDGFLYGTTAYGGGSEAGTVFKLNKNGSGFTLLRTFTGTAGDGSIPYSGVIESTDGALLGLTRTGGQHRYGTLFKLNKNGTGYTNLHHFSRTTDDGALPGAGARLIKGLDGALYGTTSFGGLHDQGTAFRITPDGGDFSVLHSFNGVDGTGANPYAGLTLGTDGAFYGTTQNGGLGCGTIFKITPAATLTISRDGNLRLAGPVGLRFAIEYLDPALTSEWITLTNVVLATGLSEILDPVSGTSDHRLYRGLLTP
jgi:uncharacterized repeat protein (TIGR03803 family)